MTSMCITVQLSCDMSGNSVITYAVWYKMLIFIIIVQLTKPWFVCLFGFVICAKRALFSTCWSLLLVQPLWCYSTSHVSLKSVQGFHCLYCLGAYFFLLRMRLRSIIGQPGIAASSAEWRWDRPPFSFVRGQDSTMWDIIWVSPQGHRSESVRRQVLFTECLGLWLPSLVSTVINIVSVISWSILTDQ